MKPPTRGGGGSYEEIAEVLEISLGTVKSRLIRGREALKKRLETFVREMEKGRGKTPGVQRVAGISGEREAEAS